MAPNIGFGVQLQRSDDGTSGGPFSTVGTVYDLTPPPITRETVDVTSHSSTDRFRERIGGLKDVGEFSLDVEFDPGSAVVAAFLADLNANTAGYYKVIFTDTGATEWGFAGFVTGFAPSTPLEGKTMASVTFQPTGKPAFIV